MNHYTDLISASPAFLFGRGLRMGATEILRFAQDDGALMTTLRQRCPGWGFAERRADQFWFTRMSR
jgi:hypothetical protein